MAPPTRSERECVTRDLNLHGYRAAQSGPLAFYGTDERHVRKLVTARPELGEALDPELDLIGAQVVYAVRWELARTVEDVLSRRTRSLLLNAAAAVRVAPQVAGLMAAELGRGADWVAAQVASFEALAAGYLAG